MNNSADKPWTMPAWMEEFRKYFVNTGGNSVEELMNDRTSCNVNAIRAILAASVKSQVILLERLDAAGEFTSRERTVGNLADEYKRYV